jgi:anti-sigma B factor antagonist
VGVADKNISADKKQEGWGDAWTWVGIDGDTTLPLPKCAKNTYFAGKSEDGDPAFVTKIASIALPLWKTKTAPLWGAPPRINRALTIQGCAGVNICEMPQDFLRIEDRPGTQPGQRILSLEGALVLSTMFQFQSTVRADTSQLLIIDFTSVPYVDSAGIGALVGAHVSRQHSGRGLALVGVSERVHNALKVTHVEQFFRFFDSVEAAEA